MLFHLEMHLMLLPAATLKNSKTKCRPAKVPNMGSSKLMDFHRIAKLLCRAMWAPLWLSDDSAGNGIHCIDRPILVQVTASRPVESGQTALKSYHLWHLSFSALKLMRARESKIRIGKNRSVDIIANPAFH